MLMTDLSFHDIGSRGLYWRLQASGAVNSRLTETRAIARAMTTPPEGTRAKVRGEATRELRAVEGGTANWTGVLSPQRTMAFPDPFAQTAPWIRVEKKIKGK